MKSQKTKISNLKDEAIVLALEKGDFATIEANFDGLKSINWRLLTDENNNSILHILLLKLNKFFSKVSPSDTERAKAVLIQLVYRLVICGNCWINRQNSRGNTALHLAVYRPHGQPFVKHLMRLGNHSLLLNSYLYQGSDPSITNNSGARVIYDWTSQTAWLTKGQYGAHNSIWDAIREERLDDVKQCLASWTRVSETHSHRRVSLLDTAKETGNYRIIRHLQLHSLTNEFVNVIMTLDANAIVKLRGSIGCRFFLK
ncbi:hypothetical protein Ciccas_005193 [Cichlidogyrus casuarinus]|uniref:Uncharacterized protein n=1 Tax=Cichlidogyrus casuarinus TaxID=1844966 RepID=A0ABD2Q9C3_9PLAT